MPVTREASGGETEAVQESAYEGENEVDEVAGKVFKRRKSYKFYFQLRILISYEEMN